MVLRRLHQVRAAAEAEGEEMTMKLLAILGACVLVAAVAAAGLWAIEAFCERRERRLYQGNRKRGKR